MLLHRFYGFEKSDVERNTIAKCRAQFSNAPKNRRGIKPCPTNPTNVDLNSVGQFKNTNGDCYSLLRFAINEFVLQRIVVGENNLIANLQSEEGA